jgi:Flp pilus assembly protein TadG
MSAFVVCLVVVFLAGAALVFDGGRFTAARADAADLAENAARAGAQQLDRLREGELSLDPARAVAAAQAFLASSGAAGAVTADTRTVTVTVSRSVSPVLLGLFGVGSRGISVTRSASPFDR